MTYEKTPLTVFGEKPLPNVRMEPLYDLYQL